MRTITTLLLLTAFLGAPVVTAEDTALPSTGELLTIHYGADGGTSPAKRLAAMYPPEPHAGETAPEGKLDAIVLVSFALSNGNTVSLMAVPELGELGYGELVGAGAEAILPEDELSPLEVFLALAPPETPVPRALIDLESRETAKQLAAGRARTDLLSEPIHVTVEELGLPSGIPTKATSSCGTGGSQYFSSNYCGSPVHPLFHCVPIAFCDANYNGGDSLWYSLTRSSYSGGWETRPRSYGRTAACGTSVVIKQQYWVSGAWVTLSTQTMQAGQVYISAWSGPYAYRRITRSRQTGSGGFRAYSDFYIYCVPQ